MVSGVKVAKKADLDAKLSDAESSAASNFQRSLAYDRDLTAMLVSDEALSVLAALKDRTWSSCTGRKLPKTASTIWVDSSWRISRRQQLKLA